MYLVRTGLQLSLVCHIFSYLIRGINSLNRKIAKQKKVQYFANHKYLIRLYHPRTISSRDVLTNYIIILKIATAIFSEKNCNKRASFLDFYVMHLSPLLLLICRVLFTNKKFLNKWNSFCKICISLIHCTYTEVC